MSTTITKHVDVDRTPVAGKTPTTDVETALNNKKAERQIDSPKTDLQSPSLQPGTQVSNQTPSVSKVTVTEKVQH